MQRSSEGCRVAHLTVRDDDEHDASGANNEDDPSEEESDGGTQVTMYILCNALKHCRYRKRGVVSGVLVDLAEKILSGWGGGGGRFVCC